MDLFDILDTNYFILIPALWIIGYALKQTPKIPDWSIIWFLSIISLAISTLAFGFSAETIINGIVAAGVSVYGHQIVKQTTIKRKTDLKKR